MVGGGYFKKLFWDIASYSISVLKGITVLNMKIRNKNWTDLRTLFQNNFKLKVARKRIVQGILKFLTSQDLTNVNILLVFSSLLPSPSLQFLSHSLSYNVCNSPPRTIRGLFVYIISPFVLNTKDEDSLLNQSFLHW